jgi:ribulose-5-phosphate 4-epimerase/fuculose-1-phosphate aldolase
MSELIYTHISLRMPGPKPTYLLNPHGMLFSQITASSLVKLGIDGKVYSTDGRFNAAGFTIHSGIYKAREDANCVMHTHTRAGGAVSLLKKGLRPISQDALSVYDDVVYHHYGVPATVEECEELGKTCQKGSHVILHNHGLLTAARTLPGALRGLYMLERACELEVMSRQLGEEPVMIDDYIVARAAQRMKQVRSDPSFGVVYFEALKRQVKKKGATDWAQ